MPRKKKRSILENLVEKELKKRKIDFIKEFSLPIKKKTRAIRIDFYLSANNAFIECDGIQHFEYKRKYHRSKKGFEAQKDRDRRVEAYSIENNYRLLRIAYIDAKWVSNLITAILEERNEIIFSDPNLYLKVGA